MKQQNEIPWNFCESFSRDAKIKSLAYNVTNIHKPTHTHIHTQIYTAAGKFLEWVVRYQCCSFAEQSAKPIVVS